METEALKRVDLRSSLLQAAQQVFAESGYASATVDDIIRRAGTSRATFYRYFRSKKDVFDELSRAAFKDMRALIKELAGLELERIDLEALQRLVVAYNELQLRQRGVTRAWMEQVERAESPVRKEAAATFQALLTGLEKPISSAGIPSRVEPEVQAALLLTLLNRATFFVFSRHSRIRPGRLSPTLATMMHRAYFSAESDRRGRLRMAVSD
jgi:AcrR family transcriptional regulator